MFYKCLVFLGKPTFIQDEFLLDDFICVHPWNRCKINSNSKNSVRPVFKIQQKFAL